MIKRLSILDPARAALREFCKLLLDSDHQDLDDDVDHLGDFCKLIMDGAESIEGIALILNRDDENLLHVIIKRPKLSPLLKLREIQNQGSLFKKMTLQENKKKESPLHCAIKYSNLIGLEFIRHIFAVSKKELFSIGMRENNDGLNALNLLLQSDLQEDVRQFKDHLDRYEQINLMQFRRDFLKSSLFSENTYFLLEVFCPILYKNPAGEGISDPDPSMTLATDQYGNNAVMFSLYANSEQVLKKVLKTLTTEELMQRALSQRLANNPITPLQFSCAFGDARSVTLLCNALGSLAPSTCIEQKTLEWCFKTQPADKKEFCDVVRVMAGFYGNEFEKSVLKREAGQSSLFSRSLGADDAIPEVLLEREPLYRIEFIAQIFESWLRPASPRQGFFPLPFAPSPVDMNVILLRRYFGMEWPVPLLNDLAIMLHSYRNNAAIFDPEPRKFFMNVLVDGTKKAAVKDVATNNSCIILALFLRTNKDLRAEESSYFSYCVDHPSVAAHAFCSLLTSLLEAGGRKLCETALSKIQADQSLYLMMLTKTLMLRPEELEEANFNSAVESKAGKLAHIVRDFEVRK